MSEQMSASESQEDYDTKVEIQKLLVQINEDMNKLKNEISSLHNLVDEHASFPITAKLVNEKLTLTAKELGIDLENLEINGNEEDSGDQEEEEESAAQSNNDEVTSTSNIAEVAAAAENLAEEVKSSFKK